MAMREFAYLVSSRDGCGELKTDSLTRARHVTRYAGSSHICTRGWKLRN